MGVIAYRDVFPRIEDDVFIAPGAWVIGDVVIGKASSIWFNTVVRGDENSIKIGSFTNIQDNSVLHVTGPPLPQFPLSIGNRVTIGHMVTVHACTIEDECLIGIGSTILDGCKVGKGSVVAAGAVLPPGFEVPPESVVMGVPAKIKKKVGENEREMIANTYAHYVKLAAEYLKAIKNYEL